MKVTREFLFDSAHYLTNYKGKCSRLHGHTYKLQVTYAGQPTDGILKDFVEIKREVENKIIKRLDHRLLNDIFKERTTAENIALWILKELDCYAVKLWETPNSFVEVDRNDL